MPFGFGHIRVPRFDFLGVSSEISSSSWPMGLFRTPALDEPAPSKDYESFLSSDKRRASHERRAS